ncbi:MAG: lysylphosphatidylglycerol synthase transmembrane domain-containing protein [Ignavibacteria bacterium]
MASEKQTDIKIKGRGGKNLILLLKIVLTIILLLYLRPAVKSDEILSAIKQADIIFILGAFILILPNIYLQFLKWEIICNKSLGEKDNKKIWRSLFYGYSGGIATPMKIGEYAGRLIVFKEKGILLVSLATLIDKLFIFVMITFSGSLAGILFFQFYYGLSLTPALMLYTVVFLIYYLIFYFASKERFISQGLVGRLMQKKYAGSFINGLREFKTLGKETVTRLSLITIILCTTYIMQFAMLVVAYSNHFNILMYFWAGLLVMFAKTMIPPVTLGEFGVREAASVIILKKMGLSSAIALNASVTIFAFNLLLPAFIGLLMILSRRDEL